jgi:hypothetical protein
MFEKLNPISADRIFNRLLNLDMKNRVWVLRLISSALDAADLDDLDPRNIDDAVAHKIASLNAERTRWEEEDGCLCFLKQDPYPENPRTIFDPLTQMICFTRHDAIGDVHDIKLEETRSWDAIRRQVLEARPDTAHIFPLFMLDHGGRMLSIRDFEDPWDSRQVGFILVPAANIPPEWAAEEIEERTKSLVEAEIKDYNHYLAGESWDVEVYTAEGEEIFRSGYFFGTQDEARAYIAEELKGYRERSV